MGSSSPGPSPKVPRSIPVTGDSPLRSRTTRSTTVTSKARFPKGEYGGGTVMLWDRGFWVTEDGGDADRALRKGELKFTLAGEKLKGSWVIVRMRQDREHGKRNNWLLIKHRDGYARESDEHPITEQDQSAASGRSMEEIAGGRGPRPKPFMLVGQGGNSRRGLALE